MHTISRAIAAIALVAVCLRPFLGPHLALAQDTRLTTVTIPTNGVSIQMPASVFEPAPADEKASGRLFRAAGGDAQLLLGAFLNEDGRSLTAYRRFVIAENYSGAEIDYAPLRRDWFVLSGTLGERTFYQRVAFTCGSRLINSWALIYPTRDKRIYDRIVERIHTSFRPGKGPAGDCRLDELAN